ncbi:MAG: phage integrase N-terminal SAM-like domain-containing protein [Candidatus Thiodiazotropha sp. (ex Codakia rugifera)]|nr:phage integrase N-terminal SAM-like domain-containing protein [Candidatus Thiodiazotropha sp. (ex Codakia rugifera)]
MRLTCLRSHPSPRTATSYIYWCRQFILFHKMQHPRNLGTAEIEAFLNHFVVNHHLVAISQSQALNALVFMYKQVLQSEFEWLDNLDRAKLKQYLTTI